jgi:hypothetical protein
MGICLSRSKEKTMDVLKMLKELRGERENVEEAIVTLERLARGQGKRRGRPPKWMRPTPISEKKGVRSAETRARMSEAQKKRWAKSA